MYSEQQITTIVWMNPTELKQYVNSFPPSSECRFSILLTTSLILRYL